MAERAYVSNKNETVRMFESDFMEFFSRVHPAIPLVLYLPVVGYMLYVSIWQQKLSILVVAGLFTLGILLWTLIEYLIHRSACVSFLWSLPSDFLAPGAWRVCRIGFWLRLL